MAPLGVNVQTCALDVYNIFMPTGEYDWEAAGSSIQSAVMGKDGMILFLHRISSGFNYLFNTRYHTMEKMTPAVPGVTGALESVAGGVYVESSETIYWVPNHRNQIHVLRMHDVKNLVLEVLRSIPAKTNSAWDQLLGSPVLVDTSIYFPPMDADYTLVLHIAPDTSTTLEQLSWNSANSVNKFIIAVRIDNKLVFVPRARDSVAIMDLSLAGTPTHEVPVPGDLTGNLNKYSGRFGSEHKFT